MQRRGLVERIGHGLYLLAGSEVSKHHSLAVAAKSVPGATVRLLSALRFHDLTTQSPHAVWLAIGPKARQPKGPGLRLRVVRFSGPALTEGIEPHRIEGVRVPVYGPGKTVADCFKFRRKIGLDVTLEALRECWRERRADMDELWRCQCHAPVSGIARVMVPRNPKDTAASVRQRLLNASRATGEPFDLLLTRYGVERLLFRLGCSRWSPEFVLEGAVPFAIWHEIPMRPTRDVDLLGLGSPEVERLADIFRSICTESVIEDGLSFDAESVSAAQIRETNACHGVRIRPGATLAGTKIPLQVDVGLGDAVVPDPEEIAFLYPALGAARSSGNEFDPLRQSGDTTGPGR